VIFLWPGGRKGEEAGSVFKQWNRAGKKKRGLQSPMTNEGRVSIALMQRRTGGKIGRGRGKTLWICRLTGTKREKRGGGGKEHTGWGIALYDTTFLVVTKGRKRRREAG